jgi:hypothetical protein
MQQRRMAVLDGDLCGAIRSVENAAGRPDLLLARKREPRPPEETGTVRPLASACFGWSRR